jgi:UDP-N-acetylmuramoyl-tripeptide--D-alanyl-D-alanine ligase
VVDRAELAGMLTLGVVIEAISNRDAASVNVRLMDAHIDSRQVDQGSLFIALPGERVDGHEFLQQAFERGALVAIVEKDPPEGTSVLDLRRTPSDEQLMNLRFPLCLRVENSLEAMQRAAAFWRSKLDLRVIGITGSVGKSTTKEMVAAVLARRYRTLRSPGNLNNEIGLPLTLLRLRKSHERAVLEMGFYVPGEIALLCEWARPQIGVITNISQVHLERAGSMEAIFNGKSELVEALPPAPDGTAVLNHDEPLVRRMADRTQAEIFYYGLTSEADLWADEIEGLGLGGVRFVMHYEGDAIHVRVPLLGRHSVHTALRASAVGLVDGLTWEEIVAGLQGGQSQLRLFAVPGPGGSLLLDDTYNAAPTSMIAALNLLAELEGRRIAVLGDMLELGEFEERGHRMVGVRAAEVVDELVTVGERARWIADEALRAGLQPTAVTQLSDVAETTEFLRGRVRSGDVVLIKGSRALHMEDLVAALGEDE